jgi:hypothetical protein
MKNKKNSFIYDIRKAQRTYTKLLKPRVWYSSECDIFSMFWGALPSKFCIELNLLGKGDMRFDINKNNSICGVEIDDFSEVLKNLDCDKEPFKSIVKKRIKNAKKSNKHKHR